MKFLDLFKKTLKEERKIPDGKKHLLLLDIDDTLLKAASNMKIYRKLPTDKVEVALTPEEYAHEVVTPATKKYYDYRDFRDPKKVYESIVKGMPYINNLKVVDDFYKAGADLGILTARGCEDAVYKAIKAFLKVKDVNGNLVRPNIPRERVHGVNDDNKKYPGETDGDKKKNVIRSYYKDYDYITLFDDDVKNIKNALSLKHTDDEAKKKVRTIDAAKNRASVDFDNDDVTTRDEEEVAFNMNESELYEMALADVTTEIINRVNKKDYKNALILYFDKIKNQPSYQGKLDSKSAIKHMLSFGITRTFGALEKKGDIPAGSAAELKKFGIDNIDDIAASVEYEGNPDFEKPKREKPNWERKTIRGATEEEVAKKLEAAKAEGWKGDITKMKKAHNKTDGDYFAVLVMRPKAIKEEVLSEMAVKDVSQDIIKDINDGDYVSALRKYFDKIKGTATYAAKPNLDSAYSHMLSYGISRTFNALEKKGIVPEGTSAKLKEVGGKQKAEILNGIQDTTERKPEEQKTKDKPKTYEKGETGALKKIADRVAIYSKMRDSIKDYMHSSDSIRAFIYDEEKNGSDGIDTTIAKPNVTKVKGNLRDFMKTKTERYIEPMMEFRAKFIPKFLVEKFDKEMPVNTKKNIEKAARLGQEYEEATKNYYYAGRMVSFLNNIVEGLIDFNVEHKGENLTDAEALKALKSDGIFPYNDFASYEKWLKNRDMRRDKLAVENARKSDVTSASIPTEIYRVRDEYVAFLNAMERAQVNDTIADFITDPKNYAVVRAVLETPSNSAQDLKAFVKDNPKLVGNGLAPRLKVQYDRRTDMKFDTDSAEHYAKLDSDIKKLVSDRGTLLSRGEDTDSIDIKLAKAAEKVSDVILDRLAALDILLKSSQVDGGVLKDYQEQAKRYHAIKLALAKVAPKSKKAQKIFDPQDPKYDKYYDSDKEQ